MGSLDTDSGDEMTPKRPSMFSGENEDKWLYHGFIRPSAQNLDDVLLVTSAGTAKIADTFALDGTSIRSVLRAFYLSHLAFKNEGPKQVFFMDDCDEICAIDYSPFRQERVKIRRVQDVYSELRSGDVASFGVLQKILKDHPNILEGAEVEDHSAKRMYVFARDFASRLKKFVDEE